MEMRESCITFPGLYVNLTNVSKTSCCLGQTSSTTQYNHVIGRSNNSLIEQGNATSHSKYGRGLLQVILVLCNNKERSSRLVLRRIVCLVYAIKQTLFPLVTLIGMENNRTTNHWCRFQISTTRPKSISVIIPLDEMVTVQPVKIHIEGVELIVIG